MKNDAIQKPQKITYETLWKAIIRPPRDEYYEEDLGSPYFIIDRRHYVRKDFELLNFQGYLIKVSMIEPDIRERPQAIMPCVIYLHANASSRIEGLHVRRYLLKRNINLCVFDFQGSGMSEGDYISLGYHEKHQVKNIVDFVEKYPGVGKIGLWGRSMGAATALIYTSMDKRIKAVVVDSPFSDFRQLAKEMVRNQIKIPVFLVEGALSIIGKSVKNRNGMDINEIKAIDCVQKCDVPIIFIHARDDELVPYHHSEDLLKNYKGEIKELKSVNGGHNGKRPSTVSEDVGDFFAKYLDSGYTKGDSEKQKNFMTKILFRPNLFCTDKEDKEDKKKDDTSDGKSNTRENEDKKTKSEKKQENEQKKEDKNENENVINDKSENKDKNEEKEKKEKNEKEKGK